MGDRYASAAVLGRPVVDRLRGNPFRNCGFQNITAEPAGIPHRDLDVPVVRIVFKKEDDFAARTLPGISGLKPLRAVPKIGPAAFAVHLNRVVEHLGFQLNAAA